MISMTGSAFPSSSVPPQPQFTGVYPAIVAAVGGDGTGSTTTAATAGTTAASTTTGAGAAGTGGADSGSIGGGSGTGTDSAATLIQMYIPQVLGTALSNWAPPLNPVAGVVPNVGDSVFAMFQGGDPRYASYVQAITAQGLAAAIATATNTDPTAIQPVSGDDTGEAGDTGVPADAGHVHPAGGGGDDGGGGTGSTVMAAYKTTSTSRASNASLTVDPDLELDSLTASTVYEFRCVLSYTSASGTPGFQWGFGTDSDSDALVAAAVCVNSGVTTTTINPVVANTATYTAATSAGVSECIMIDGTFTTASDATGIGLFWAQITSNANATVLNAGSYILVQQLSG